MEWKVDRLHAAPLLPLCLLPQAFPVQYRVDGPYRHPEAKKMIYDLIANTATGTGFRKVRDSPPCHITNHTQSHQHTLVMCTLQAAPGTPFYAKKPSLLSRLLRIARWVIVFWLLRNAWTLFTSRWHSTVAR